MAKLLRLDVAQLTDVGRKREHNEDNMAYVIPKDPLVMARKGALFIVADGMGGHAAGEVASEIAVDTVSNAYYQDDNEDVTVALLNAIRRANAAIHQRAAENMLRSGMGTTCVAAVLRGNMAYIANVGDSRAYLIRKSQIRQVSQDHSWVAEQVRAGLLTEEQARTHAQRNVITRSLGTQTEVEIDVFREALEEGDTLVLCSDGLSGLVNDEELLRTVEQFVPQESVYHLVERANENGGPDNITAIVSRVQELGVEPPSVRQPVPVGGPELSNEDTARLYASAGAGMNMATRNGEAPLPGSPFPYTSGPLALPESDTAPQPVLKTKKQHGRLFYPTIALLILFVLAAGFSGFYYFLHTYQNSTITSTLDSTNGLITQATNEVNNHNLPQALQDLSKAQQQLQNLQKNYTLGSSSATRLGQLQTQLVNETRLAINAYNKASNITVLPCTKSAPSNLTGETVGTLALIQSGNTTAYYALGQDGKIYQLIQSSNSNGSSQYTLNYPFSLSTGTTNTQITSMVGAKEKIFALSEELTNNTPGNFLINLLSPGQRTGLQSARQQPIEPLAKNGQVPGLITAWDNGNNSFDVYVVLQSPTSSPNNNNATILSYAVDNKGTFSQPKQTSISVSEPIRSITATPNQLFLLLEGGEVESLPITNHTLATALIPVLTSQAIAPTLAPGAQNFTASTPVPTVTPQKASLALSVPGASTATLSAGVIPDASGNPQVHLFVGDPANHRVLDLTQPTAAAGGPDSTPTATGGAQGANVTLNLAQQYTSPGYFNAIKSVAVDPSGTTFILSQNTPGSESLLVVGPNAQSTCAA